MAKKAFEIQSSDLVIGGVNLQAGATSIVIPGVTQATNYFVEEVDETGDQTNTLNLPIVIDNVTHAAKVADAGASVLAYATYSVELDDEDYVDEIEVTTAGTYVGSEVDRNADFDMWGYTGSDAEGYFTNWVTGDWTQIPFRPKMRAGDVENVGGSGADTGDFVFNNNFLTAEGEGVDQVVIEGETDGDARIDIPNNNWAENSKALTITNTGAQGVKVSAGSNGDNVWAFEADGGLQFPDGTTQTTAYTGTGGTNPTVSYKGFKAVYARMYIDEPTISKVLIYQDTVTTTPTLEVDADTSRDLFKVSGLANSSVIALVNIFGSDDTYPTSLSTLQHFAKSIIDNVILDNGDENTNIDTYNIKSRFYDNFNTFASRAGNRYKNFEFLRTEWLDISGTGGSGTGASFDLFRDFHSDLIDNVNTNQGGINYQVGNVITISGASLGGTTPANNVVITVSEVGEEGQIQNYDYTGILPANTFPLDNIDDGGDDQYDGANYIFTNIQGDSYVARYDDDAGVSEGAWAVNYNGGNVNESGGAWFGTGSEYVVTYNDSIFGLFVTGANINWIATNGNSGFDGDGRADTGSLQLVDTDGLINGNQTFVLNADGSVKFPDGTIQTTAYVQEDPNVWVQDFETFDTLANTVATANSVEYLSNGDIVAVFTHYFDDGDGRYNSIARFTPTGEKVWSMKFQGDLYTDGWGLAVDNNFGNYIYLAGSKSSNSGYEVAVITKLAQADGAIIWSKTYDVGYNNTNVVIDVTGTDIAVVGYAYNGTDNQIVTTKIQGGTGQVLWSKALNGQGTDQAYGMAVDNNYGGEIVTVGYIDQYTEPASYPVTPLTGSTIGVLVVNRSDLSGATFTDTWQVAGTDISGYAGISAINFYNALTGTTREGSGAFFNITDNGNGTYSVAVDDQGNNYLAGHKILVLGTDLGGATPANDCIITVDSNDVQTGMVVSNTGTAAGTVPATYNLVTGTNYQVGSGLSFDFTGDAGSTYTEHITNIFAGGSNYVTGDVITIPGTQLGGTTPENDLVATVTAVDGAVTQFNTFLGTQQTTTYRVMVEDPTVDFSGPGSWTLDGSTTDTADRMVVVKYDSNGSILWQQAVQVEPGYDCKGADADIDSNGNIYVCGNFNYDNNGNTDQAMILIKFNRSGTKQWTRKVQGPCEDYATSVVVGPDNCLYLSAVTAGQGGDYSMVIAKYNLNGTVAWSRVLDSITNWTFNGQFFFGPFGGGSTIAVRDGYVTVVGTFGNLDQFVTPHAILAQFDADGKIFTRGDYDFKEVTFNGQLDATASNITVTDAGKVSSDYAGAFTVGDLAPTFDLASNLVGTIYRKIIADNELGNSNHVVSLNANGSLRLPAGGTITEGYVTSNPTIQLTPARPDVASQKLVIKGGGLYTYTDNGIEINYNDNTATVGDTLTFYVYSNTYADQTLYWWIYPQGAGIGDTESGTVVMEGSSGMFSILIDSDDYEFTVRVSPEADNYDPANVGVESGLINPDSPTLDADHHLHLTTGNLTETSIFLGTDNHNVRTNTDGTVQITTTTYGAVDRLNSSTSQGEYNTGTYTGLTTTGGSGTGLTVNATSTGGYIDFVTIVNPGTGYTDGDVLTLVGGDGLGCTLNVVVLGTSKWKFNAIGTTTFPTLTVPIEDNVTPTGTGQVLQFGDSTQQAIIFGPVSTATNTSAERIIIQGAPGYTGTAGEGGDVYVWAGPGGSANGGGGDIKVRAGEGIGSGTGGYLNFQAGNAGDGVGANGGYINIESGSSANGTGGNVAITANSGGQLQLYTEQNGSIILNTASGGNQWVLSSTGTTTLPGALVKSTVAKTGVVLPTTTGVVSGLSHDSVLGGLTDGTYGPFTLTGVTLSVTVFGNVINGFTNVSGTATVNDVLGTIDSGDVGGTAGTTITITVSTVVQSTPTAIDLTKSINSIGDGTYTLADGVEGQVMYLVPNIETINSVSNVFVIVNHARDGASQYQDSTLNPFSYYVGAEQVFTSICTLIYTQDHWQQIGGGWTV